MLIYHAPGELLNRVTKALDGEGVSLFRESYMAVKSRNDGATPSIGAVEAEIIARQALKGRKG